MSPWRTTREWPTTSRGIAGQEEAQEGQETGTETAIWDGFIKAPTQLETTIQESLLYPLWGAQGVVLLVVFPPILWLISVLSVRPCSGNVEWSATCSSAH